MRSPAHSHKYHQHYIEEIRSELRSIEKTQLSDEQKSAVDETQLLLEKAQSSTNIIQLWSCVNLARVQRAKYLPDDQLVALAIAEQKREKEVFDKPTRDKWQSALDDVAKQLMDAPDDRQKFHCRQVLFRYLQETSRKWNNANARENSRATTLIVLSIVCCVMIAVVSLVLNSLDIWLSVLFGFLGGLVSSLTTISDWPLQFRSSRLALLAFFIRPLTGAIVAIMLFQFLQSNISPIQITPWRPETKPAWIAAVSFAAGLSERVVLGKLKISDE